MDDRELAEISDSWSEDDKQIKIVLLALDGLFGGCDGRCWQLFFQPSSRRLSKSFPIHLRRYLTHINSAGPPFPFPGDTRDLPYLFRLVKWKVGEEDALVILYEVLLGVDVEEEKLVSIRNHCDTELLS
uniref:Uncharacterized protein n=1 Tax=Amphimedon queenslandica TaxID=400682 RepID=A0A1X7SM61_AMPQE